MQDPHQPPGEELNEIIQVNGLAQDLMQYVVTNKIPLANLLLTNQKGPPTTFQMRMCTST